MYIGECQNWPHSSEGDFLHFETLGTCQGSNPNNLHGSNPSPDCGSPFGDTGWFVENNSTAGAQNRSLALWNNKKINRYWEAVYNANYGNWININFVNNQEIFYLDQYDDEPDYLVTGLGWMYRLDYNQDSQVPADVLTLLAADGWQGSCGTDHPGGNALYTGCITRIRFKRFVPDYPFPLNPDGERRPHSNPSVACGAPYGDGWFERHPARQTIIIENGQEIYNGSYIHANEYLYNGFRYIRRAEPDRPGQSADGYGWHEDGVSCGYTASPNGDNIDAHMFDRIIDY